MTVGVSAPTAPRVGIVGVRRLRQGLGEHFARWLVAAGAQVPAFIGRTPESIDEGRRLLLARGIDARGFTSLEALMAAEPIEALVIASPAETHHEWLQRALAARLHVLCEKPFVWPPGAVGDSGSAAAIAHEFPRRDLVLSEHCQWPFTLDAFRRLHPGALDEPLRELEMELAPSSRGEAMLVDTLSHPVSLLQGLLELSERPRPVEPDPFHAGLRAAPPLFSSLDPDAPRIDLLAQVHDGLRGPTYRLRLRVETSTAHPRPAAYVINGRRADRRILLPEYAMSLADGEREVATDDPMKLAVADFVRAVIEARLPAGSRPNAARDARRASEIVVRMRLVSGIVAAFHSRAGN